MSSKSPARAARGARRAAAAAAAARGDRRLDVALDDAAARARALHLRESSPRSDARRRASGDERTGPPFPVEPALCGGWRRRRRWWRRGCAALGLGSALRRRCRRGRLLGLGRGLLGGLRLPRQARALHRRRRPARRCSRRPSRSRRRACPTGRDSPSATRRLRSTPSPRATSSMIALSVSTSAIGSPVFTASPSFFSHLTRRPSSIVGESASMNTFVAMVD